MTPEGSPLTCGRAGAQNRRGQRGLACGPGCGSVLLLAVIVVHCSRGRTGREGTAGAPQHGAEKGFAPPALLAAPSDPPSCATCILKSLKLVELAIVLGEPGPARPEPILSLSDTLRRCRKLIVTYNNLADLTDTGGGRWRRPPASSHRAWGEERRGQFFQGPRKRVWAEASACSIVQARKPRRQSLRRPVSHPPSADRR